MFLVIDQFAEQIADRLRGEFPDCRFVAAVHSDAKGVDFGEARGLFAFGPSFDDSVIKRMPGLEWLQFLSSGTDTLVSLPSLSKKVIVTSCHGIHGPPVSEMAMVHMLTLSHDVRRMQADQRRANWNRVPQPTLVGKIVTILGTGLIATELASRCKAMGMTIYGVSATPRDIPFFDRVFARHDFKAAAAAADFLVLLTPLTDDTRGIVDRDLLSAMKPSAFLINVARGGVCDDVALLEALRNKVIAGAGLDAFLVEPLPAEHPFWTMDNVFVTPHIAGQAENYADLILPILFQNLKAFLAAAPQQMRNLVRGPDPS